MKKSKWFWWSFLPVFNFAAWIHAAVRTGRNWSYWSAVIYAVPLAFGLLAGMGEEEPKLPKETIEALNSMGGTAAAFLWIAGMIHALLKKDTVDHQIEICHQSQLEHKWNGPPSNPSLAAHGLTAQVPNAVSSGSSSSTSPPPIVPLEVRSVPSTSPIIPQRYEGQLELVLPPPLQSERPHTQEGFSGRGLCPSCGAAVNLDSGQTVTKCQSCETVVTLQQVEAEFTKFKNSKVGGKMLLAEISLKSGDPEKALGFYDKVIEHDEKAAEAWLGRGICLVHNIFVSGDEENENYYQDTKGAVSSLEAAIQFATNPEAMRSRAAKVIAEYIAEQKKNRGDIVVRSQVAHDNDLLAWAIERDHRSEFLLKTGLEFYFWAQKNVLKEARFDMESILEETRWESQALMKLHALLKLNLGKYIEAIEKYAEAATGEGRDSGFAKEIGELFRKENEDARQHLKKIEQEAKAKESLSHKVGEGVKGLAWFLGAGVKMVADDYGEKLQKKYNAGQDLTAEQNLFRKLHRQSKDDDANK